MTRTAVLQKQRYLAMLESETDLEGWKVNVRKAIAANIAPENLRWDIAGRPRRLALDESTPLPTQHGMQTLSINKSLRKQIMTALMHGDPDRFDLAYRLVYRSQTEKYCHLNPADRDVKKLNNLAKSVRRDIHKMHAFVRFRKTEEKGGREQFVAWFEPDHHITAAVAPFFRDRFTGMDWLIVTPEKSISWDGKQLTYGPGGSKADVPPEDAVVEEWQSYYANIFNPARVKLHAMRSEMPVKYWKNLPEARLIPGLVEASGMRVDKMIARERDTLPSRPDVTDRLSENFGSLDELYSMLSAQNDFPHESFSEKLIKGEGPSNADVMFIGEQPGDKEDQLGRLFVGPAGKILDKAMTGARIDRQSVFLTNAVKRFKYVQRGKRRIHQTPSSADIKYYRWWVEQEQLLVRPKLIVALGATAAASIYGKKVAVSRYRGTIMPFRGEQKLLVTVHPSYLLRIPDEAGRKIEYQKFQRDMELIKRFV